jgi:hypothetical protein
VRADALSHAPLLLLLGAWHGVNPAMGWLFAVALGLQEHRRGAVWRALPPLAAGHAIAVAAALLLAAALGVVLPPELLRGLIGATLMGFGIYRLVRPRHPRIGGMRMSPAGLAGWSALVASAHGAGLMVVPVLIGSPSAAPSSAQHGVHTAALLHVPDAEVWIAAGIHTVGYLLVVGALAALVYEKLGLRLLGRVWFNLDLLWGAALIVAGGATVLA